MLSSIVSIFVILSFLGILYGLYKNRSMFEPSHLLMFCVGFSALLFYHFPLEHCEHIGHEAFYFELSQGLHPIQNHDTLHYPTQQVLYWMLQFVPIPNLVLFYPIVLATLVPIFFSILCSISISTQPKWPGFWWMLSLPAFLDWSCSFYNIIPPLLFALLYIIGLQRNNTIFAVISGFLLLGARIEWVVILPLLYWSSLSKQKKIILSILLSIYFVFLLWLFQQEIPGEGERIQAFWINISIIDFLDVYSGVGIILIPFALIHQQTIPKKYCLYLLAWAMGIHIIMSTFNDYGSRHIFPIWLVIGYILVHSRYMWVPALLLHVVFCIDHRRIHYASIELWDGHISSIESPNLPAIQIDEAQKCARIAESETFQQNPVLSHFNVYDHDEYQTLLQKHGCVYWCLEYDQWRWTSLGISDRNYRINKLYTTKMLGIMKENEQQCVLYDVQER